MQTVIRLLVPHVERIPRLLVVSGCVGLGLTFAVWAITSMERPDVTAYDAAATRWWGGEPLYRPGSMYDAAVYRYAPWFAFAWALFGPLASPLLLAGSAISMVYVAWVTRHAFPVNVLLVGMLLSAVSDGNVHPLLIAALIWARDRWTGAIWVAVAASIKAAPAIFALVYLGRREWRRFGLSVGVMALTALPLLAFDLSAYPTDAGERVIFWGTSLYMPVLALGGAATVLFARSRYAWLVAAATVVVAMPRFWPYDLTWLLLALRSEHVGDESPGYASRAVGIAVQAKAGARLRETVDGTD